MSISTLPPTRTYRGHLDMVIEMLADENAELHEQLLETQIDRDSYRRLAQEAIHALHLVTNQRDTARKTIRELREIASAERRAA
jgi:hypothetical protein